MKKILLMLVLTLVSQFSFANDKVIIKQLVDGFLANDIGDDYKNHDRFWAEDLIYTSSSGARFDKKFIMDDIKAANSPKNKKAKALPPVYWAEETQIRQYGDTAVVAFKLRFKENKNAKVNKQSYYNTGTLLKRDNKWQVVAWQATIIPLEKK